MNPGKGIIAPLIGFASRLRFPVLFFITLALFVVDLFVPDFLPYADEILLGLGTVVLGKWKQRQPERKSDTLDSSK